MMIYIGVTKRDECPAEPMIPLYLIISGSFSIFRTIWYYLEIRLFRRHLAKVVSDCMDAAMCITAAFMTTLYLFGLYWVLHAAWPNITDPLAFNYCDPTAYLLAFITIVGLLILMLFWCTCICFLAFKVVPLVSEEIALIGIPVPVPHKPNSATIILINDDPQGQ